MMFWSAVIVFVIAAVAGVLVRVAAPPLMDEPLSDEWRADHVADHGDGDAA